MRAWLSNTGSSTPCSRCFLTTLKCTWFSTLGRYVNACEPRSPAPPRGDAEGSKVTCRASRDGPVSERFWKVGGWKWDKILLCGCGIFAPLRGGEPPAQQVSQEFAHFGHGRGGASFLLVKTCILDQECAPPLWSKAVVLVYNNGNVRNFSELRRADF